MFNVDEQKLRRKIINVNIIICINIAQSLFLWMFLCLFVPALCLNHLVAPRWLRKRWTLRSVRYSTIQLTKSHRTIRTAKFYHGHGTWKTHDVTQNFSHTKLYRSYRYAHWTNYYKYYTTSYILLKIAQYNFIITYDNII